MHSVSYMRAFVYGICHICMVYGILMIMVARVTQNSCREKLA